MRPYAVQCTPFMCVPKPAIAGWSNSQTFAWQFNNLSTRPQVMLSFCKSNINVMVINLSYNTFLRNLEHLDWLLLILILLYHSHQSKKKIKCLRLLFIALLPPISKHLEGKTRHFMYLLLTLVILLLPEHLLVICFIHWITKYVPFTTNSLIWRVCFHVPNYVWDSKFRKTLRWMNPNCLSWSIFKIQSWLLYIQ